MHVLRNPHRSTGSLAAAHVAVPQELVQDAQRRLNAWPGQRPTPLHRVPRLATELGVRDLRVKDESERLGLNSFKALGAGYAVLSLAADAVARQVGHAVQDHALFRGAHAETLAKLTFCCATDGNHGRAVAWAADRLGARAVVFLPDHAPAARREAIAALGAEVRDGGRVYDDAVAAAEEAATANGWILVADTATGEAQGPGAAPASTPEPSRLVMAGYTLLFEEAFGRTGRPSHIFLQAGVGGLAAAGIASALRRWPEAPPATVVVEPERAACIYIAAGGQRPARQDLRTVMDTLAARRPSATAWPLLRAGADYFMTIGDEHVEDALGRLEQQPPDEREPLRLGPSGVAGLAAVIAAAGDDEARTTLRLGEGSRVLTIGTEGPITVPTVEP